MKIIITADTGYIGEALIQHYATQKNALLEILQNSERKTYHLF